MTVPMRISRRRGGAEWLVRCGCAWGGGRALDGLLERPGVRRPARSRAADSSARREWYTPMSSTWFQAPNALLERQQAISGARDPGPNPVQQRRVRVGWFTGIALTHDPQPKTNRIDNLPSASRDRKMKRSTDRRSGAIGSSDFWRVPDPRVLSGILRYVSGIPYFGRSSRSG